MAAEHVSTDCLLLPVWCFIPFQADQSGYDEDYHEVITTNIAR
jgi:hypothetical protein